MTSFGKTLETHFFFELRSPAKVKVLDYHLTKPLIAYVSSNNILSIWDYDKKTCLKSFSVNALESKDLTKTVTVKSIKFLDRDILNCLFPNDQYEYDSPFYLCSWLIAVAESKIHFFDYVSEKTEVITPSLLDSKLPKCVEIVDTRHIAIGCSEGYVKIFDLPLWTTSKTLKGLHHKTINHMLACRQNENNKKILVVSSLDGTMAGWNVDTETPVIKFNMLKSGKQLLTANNLEDITSISYNRVSNQIVTVTEHYITVWNSLTGDEVLRYKNIKDSHKESLVEAMYLNYGSNNFSDRSLAKGLMIGHSKSSELMVYDITKGFKTKETTLDCFTIMDFRTLKEYDKNFRIYAAKAHYEKPHLIFVGTNQGLFTISLMKTNAILTVISSPFYATYITLQGLIWKVKEFLNEDGSVKKLGTDAIQKCQSYELVDLLNRQPNILALSISNDSIFCHLIDRERLDCLPDNSNSVIKTIIGQADAVPIDEEYELRSSLDGKFFSIRYQKSGLFSIYAVTNRNIQFPKEADNMIVLDNLHPIGSVEKIFSGCASSLEWHQEKNEFAALVPVNKEGKQIEVKEKIETVSKGGFFGGKVTKRVLQANPAEIAKFILVIFQIKMEGTNPKVQMRYKDDSFTDPKKLFGGPFYGIIDNISESDFTELLTAELEPIKRDLRSVMSIKMSLFEYNENLNKFSRVGKPMLAAENLYWNLSSSLLIASYRSGFFVYKYDPKEKTFKFWQSVARKILEAFFWENLFFYITDTCLRMAVFDLKDETIDIVLVTDNQEPNYLAEIYFEEYFMKNDEFIYDTLYPHPQIKPPGHLKPIGIYDYKLLIASSTEEFYKIDLDHPFLKICLNLQFGNGSECMNEVKRLDPKTWGTIFDLFEIYGHTKEADTLLSWMKDYDLKNRCIVKRSFLKNDKECLRQVELASTTEVALEESIGLEFLSHYKTFPHIDLSLVKGAENSSALSILCKQQSSLELMKRNPGLSFCSGDSDSPNRRSLKEYLEKLMSLGN